VKPSESHKSWLTKLAHRYHEALTPEVASYLEARGIGQEAASGFLLGLVSDPDPAHEQYRGRLAIPFITPTGVVTMRFRCLDDHREEERFQPYGSPLPPVEIRKVGPPLPCEGHGKYESPAGDTTHLYNVQALHDADSEIGIAEGELEALVATQSGLPTVGCVGASNWKPFYYRLFDDFQNVYVLGDGDAAGRKWAAGLVPNIPGAVSRVQPKDYDVSSYVVEHGGQAWLETVIGVPSVQP
jgi:DNA primase